MMITNYMSKGTRSAQEDFILTSADRKTFIVADGFGGPTAGLLAAKSACEAVQSYLFKETGDLDATLPFVIKNYFSLAGNVIYNSLVVANRKLNSLNAGRTVHQKGGASALVGLIDGDLLALGNVGTCSAWLLRGDQARELVVPRSFDRLVDPFLSESPEVLQVPLISLGLTDGVEPEIFEYRIQSGDWILFKTDGVSNQLVTQLLKLSYKLKDGRLDQVEICNKINNLLNSKSFNDNSSISIVII